MVDLIGSIVTGIVRGVLNGAIGKFTPEDLQKAVDEDRDLWLVTPDSMKKWGHLLKGSYANSFRKYFDTKVDAQLILTWLSYDQPHLYRVIQPDPFCPPRPKEYAWLEKQVTKIKEEIKNL